MNTTAPASPRFDSNRAWQEASGAVNANRDVLVALSGVFIALPAFAIAVLLPTAEPQKSGDMDAAFEALSLYFQANWAGILLAALITTIGTMAILALFGHNSRPTVGEAITKGLAMTPIAILAQLLQGLALTGMVMVPTVLLGATGSKGLAALGMLVGLGFALWFWVRTSLTTPVIASENERNPLTALQRSFAITRGNSLRVLLFFFLLILAFAIAGQLMTLAFSLIGTGLGGEETGKIAGGLIGGVVQGATTVYFAAAMTTTYRQLSGRGYGDIPATFG